MNQNGFRNALKQLGMQQKEFAILMEIGERTVREYAFQGVHRMPVIILINLMLQGKVTPDDIRKAKR